MLVDVRQVIEGSLEGVKGVDFGFIPVETLEPDQLKNALEIMPTAKAVLSLAVKYNQSAVKSQHQPVSNMEFRSAYRKRDNLCTSLVEGLQENGVEAVAVTDTFALNYDLETPWLIAHKDVAEKAGIGVMGTNRIILHEQFGAAFVLASILLSREPNQFDAPADYAPCLNCNLCRTVCPTGSIGKDNFDMMGCYTHNYRNRGNSLGDLVQRSGGRDKGLDALNYDDVSKLWASVQEGFGFSCNRCVAVCPAATAEKQQFTDDRKSYYQTYVHPFVSKNEVVYVKKGSRAEGFVMEKGLKRAKRVSNGLTLDSIDAFKHGLKIVLDHQRASGVNRRFGFQFTGHMATDFVAVLEEGILHIEEGPPMKTDMTLVADGDMWLQFLKNQKLLLKGLITGKMKIKGSPSLLKEFGDLFPV